MDNQMVKPLIPSGFQVMIYENRALKTTKSSVSWMKERRVLTLVFDIMFDCILADISDRAYEIPVSP